jgi:hypothetical protein
MSSYLIIARDCAIQAGGLGLLHLGMAKISGNDWKFGFASGAILGVVNHLAVATLIPDQANNDTDEETKRHIDNNRKPMTARAIRVLTRVVGDLIVKAVADTAARLLFKQPVNINTVVESLGFSKDLTGLFAVHKVCQEISAEYIHYRRCGA